MATGQYSNSYLDVIGEGQERLDRYNATLRETKATIIEINNTAKGLGGGTFSDSVQQQEELRQRTKQASEELLKQKETRRLAASEERELNRLIREEETQLRNKARAEERAAIADRMREEREYVNMYKQLLKDRERAEAEAVAASTRAAQQQQQAAINAVDRTSLVAMRQTLRDLQAGYDRLTEAERRNINISGNLKNRIIELNAEINKNLFATGRFQTDVGNYTSALSGLGFSVRNIVSELPNAGISLRTFAQSISNNLIPLQQSIAQLNQQNAALAANGQPTVSVGKALAGAFFSWGTAISLVIIGVLKLIDYMGKSNKEQEKAVNLSRELNSLGYLRAKQGAEIAESYAKENVALEALRIKIESANVPQKDRISAYEELQRLYPAYFGNLSQEEVLAGRVADAYKSVSEAIMSKARLAAYNDDLAKVETDIVRAGDRIESIEYDRKSRAKLRKDESGYYRFGGENTDNVFTDFNVRGVRYPSGETDGNGKPVQTNLYNDIIKYNVALERQKAILEQIKNVTPKANTGTVATGRAQTYSSGNIANARAYAMEPAKEKASELAEYATINREIVDNDRKSLSERIEAYRQYIAYKKAIIVTEKNAQIQAARDTITELNKEEKNNNSLIGSATGKNKDATQQSLQNKNKVITGQIENLNRQIARLTRERSSEQSQLEAQSEADLQSIRDSNARRRIQSVATGLQEISDQESEARQAQKDEINRQYDAGELTFKQYRARIGKINADEDNITLARQKEFLKTALDNLMKEADVPPEVIAEIRKRLNAAYDKAQGNTGKGDSSAAAGQRYLSAAASELAPYTSFANTLLNAFEQASKRRSDAIDNEIAKLKERAEVEIENVKTSAAFATATEQEKALKIAQINADAAVKEKALEREKIERQRRLAAFQKALNIAALSIGTAKAVIDALKDDTVPNFYVRLANSIAAGLIGGAQIAAAASVPLPAYAKGGDHPGGLARVGDGGNVEVVRMKDGSLYLTPDTDTVVDLPASTIYPSVQDYLRNAPQPGMSRTNRDRQRGISTARLERQMHRVANGIDELVSFGPARFDTFEAYRNRKLHRR